MTLTKRKVLILSASPRKGGNSDLLCDQFALGAREAGHKAEKIHVHDRKIGFCLGCMTCQSTGVCVQKDDMNEILPKIVDADVLVMATPIYFYSLNAQLKVLIDRTCPRYTEISGKKAYFIATCADTRKESMNAAIASFRGFLDCLGNVKESGIICATGVTAVGDIKDKPEMAIAYEMGKAV
jgi:multimeric flavodoxin WrbA